MDGVGIRRLGEVKSSTFISSHRDRSWKDRTRLKTFKKVIFAKSVLTYVRTQVQYKGVKTSAKANTRISS